jgi:hypothetical protein
MKPKKKFIENKSVVAGSEPEKRLPLQELFDLQVKDESLSANQVLSERKFSRGLDEPAPLFVP